MRASRLGKVARVDLGIRADAALVLSALLQRLAQKTDSAFLNTALANYAAIQKELARPVASKGSAGAVRPEYVFATLDRLAAQDCIFTVDTGMNNLWSSHYLTPGKGRAMIGSFMHGSMANAMPQAIGAAVSCPGRQIISLSGDGGLSMLLGDLLTIVQYRLPVKILVTDNRTLGFVKWEMEMAGYAPNETSLANPDFGDLARAMGFTAATVNDPGDLEKAMQAWLDAAGPALLSVVTDPNAASFTFSRKMMEGAKPTSHTENFGN